MKLSEYIEQLQILEADGHGNLNVCLEDWGEEYELPTTFDSIRLCNGKHKVYTDREGLSTEEGSYICLGGY